MAGYKGISTKIMKDGSKAIMVRFKFQNRIYPVKNFTKLFGCKTETQAYNKLQEVKVLIAQGNNPLIYTPHTLNDFWDQRLEEKVASGEWTNSTPKNYQYFYDAHIRNTIGHLKLDKVGYEDLKKVLKKISNRQPGTKNTFKRLLRPMFAEAVKSGVLQENVVDKIDTFQESSDRSIEKRTSENELEIARQLYRAIPKYKVLAKAQEQEIKMFLMMVLLTAHRMGEIRKLRKENVVLKENKIISPKNITKTKEEYHFPIPEECREYIEGIESGLLFPTLKRGSTYQIFQRLLNLTEINFYNDKTLSLHDTRRLMLMIMIRDCKIDSMLADSCLSHKQSGVINHYLNFSYQDKVEAYEKYWELIRKEQLEENSEVA